MSDSKRLLPDFSNPPVVEVALSVQFEPLVALRTPQIGLLWKEFRPRFPKTKERPPLNAVIEKFGPPEVHKPDVQIQMLPSPPVPRVWFLNETGTELIQVQQDRFVHNWRKVGTGDVYPRYERVREVFRNELNTFKSFLSREKIGEILPDQCEVTYVNHFVAGAGWNTHAQLDEVLALFKPKYSDPYDLKFEDTQMASRFVIPNPQSPDLEPLGRLHISVAPGFRRDNNQPIFSMTLTARGRPEGQGLEGVFRFLDIGREAVVRGFAAVTTSRMHEIWGRRDAR